MPYAHPEYLAETDWLEQRLSDPGVRIVEVTGMLNRSLSNQAKVECFDKEHIPGAQFLDIANAKGPLSDTEAQLPWTWPTAAQFQTCMHDLGVAKETAVVVYARTPRPGIDFGLMWCTRAWWIMHHHGVTCRVLNGGYEKWLAEGKRVSSFVRATTTSTHFPINADVTQALATKDDVLSATTMTDHICLVDALPNASFNGHDPVRYGPRKGHIAHAVNVPMTALVEPETGVFKSAEAIRTRFESAGVKWDKPVITYCGGAIAATVDAFALRLCGHDMVRVYDGSLAEWTLDPQLPMTDPSKTPSA